MLFTHTGIYFDVTNPQLVDINIIDIANALSKDCRYGGQCKTFYSVAEHCVHLSRLKLSEIEQKILLLHDGTEAYLRDIVSDIKQLPEFSEYRKLENQLYPLIMRRFGLPETPFEETSLIDLDRNIRRNEIESLFDLIPLEWETLLEKYQRIPGLTIAGWPPNIAFNAFMIRYEELFYV
jgi:uncharacterized protein